MKLGKRVKKLIWQNKYTLQDIARMCDSTIEECSNAYEKFMGHKIPASFLIAGNKKQQDELRKLILQKKKILLFGDNGVGKSSLPRLISKEIGWRILYSYPRSTEDLLKDFGELPLKTKNTIFVIEGDSFYWRAYGLVNHYVKEAKNPIIIIVNNKKTVHGTVSKQLVTMKLLPPSKKDIELFIRKKFPNWDGTIDDIYDKDMRITLRKIKYNITTYKPKNDQELNAQQVAYKLLKGNCELGDFKNCKNPLLFIINWLGYNSHKFYYNTKAMNKISFVDAFKYNYKRKYLNGVLLSIPKQQRRAKMTFPAIKFKPPKEVEENWERKRTKKKAVRINKVKKQELLKFTGDMIL